MDDSRKQLADKASVQKEARTATECTVSDIWKELLKAESINIDEDFFALGGQSILAASIVNRVRNEFGVDVPLESLLDKSATIEKLSNHIDEIVKDDEEVVSLEEHDLK